MKSFNKLSFLFKQRKDVGSKIGPPSYPGSSGIFYLDSPIGVEPETTTLVNAMTVAPTAVRQTNINNLIKSLKDSGVWSKLDVLHLYRAHTEQAARLNWKNPGTHDLEDVGTPTSTFLTDDALQSNSGGSNTNCYQVADSYTTDEMNNDTYQHRPGSNSLGILVEEDTRWGTIVGFYGPYAISYLRNEQTTTEWWIRSHNMERQLVHTGVKGVNEYSHFGWSDDGTDAVRHFFDGSVQATGTTASRDPFDTNTHPLKVFPANINASFKIKLIALHSGGNLTNTEWTSLYNALETFRAAVDAE